MLDFSNYEHEAIKIDTKPIYKSDLESDWFSAWEQGNKKLGNDPEWLHGIADRTSHGARHIRIKLIDKSDPLAYQMHTCAMDVIYPDQMAAGAEIYFMYRSDFDNLVRETFPDGWVPNDFWLFDMKSGIEQFYTRDFAYRDSAPMSDDITQRYITLRSAVLASDKLMRPSDIPASDSMA